MMKKPPRPLKAGPFEYVHGEGVCGSDSSREKDTCQYSTLKPWFDIQMDQNRKVADTMYKLAILLVVNISDPILLFSGLP